MNLDINQFSQIAFKTCVCGERSEMSALRLLFNGPSIKVQALDGCEDVTWVSFGSAEFGVAFGHSYFAKRGDAALFLVPSENHWYQKPDVWDALQVVTEHINRRGRIVSYGSSMGGFAALAFSDQIAPNLIIAAAPQCSICPTVVGHFDRRWEDVAARTKFERRDARDKLTPDVNVAFIYDPFHKEDRLNVEMIAEVLKAPMKIPVPLGGHGVLDALDQVKLLKPTIDALVDGTELDVKEYINLYKSKRRTTHNFFVALGDHFYRRQSYRRSSEFYLRSIARNETDYAYRAVCDSLWSLGFKSEATFAAKRACELDPRHGGHWVRYAFALMEMEKIDEALAMLIDVSQKMPDNAAIYNAISIGFRQKNELRLALPYLRLAVNLMPGNSIWRAELDWLESSLGSGPINFD
jgi:tetratricopeptide (TPR) repeat protein